MTECSGAWAVIRSTAHPNVCCEIPVVVQTDESHHDGKSNAGATVEAVSRGDVSTLRLPLVPVVEA